MAGIGRYQILLHPGKAEAGVALRSEKSNIHALQASPYTLTTRWVSFRRRVAASRSQFFWRASQKGGLSSGEGRGVSCLIPWSYTKGSGWRKAPLGAWGRVVSDNQEGSGALKCIVLVQTSHSWCCCLGSIPRIFPQRSRQTRCMSFHLLAKQWILKHWPCIPSNVLSVPPFLSPRRPNGVVKP
jgi:hypothetical protein